MSDHYKTLGVEKTATNADIKAAYRRLANKYHPDKPTGDADKFKEISTAYNIIGDDEERAKYDMERNPHFNMHDENIFSQHFDFHFGHGFTNSAFTQKRNKDLIIKCHISLKDVYNGKKLEAKYKLTSGKQQTVTIDIPPGIENGTTLRIKDYGDDSNSALPRGWLNVIVEVTEDSTFLRSGFDLVRSVEISVFEAMLGCTKDVEDINGNICTIKMRPGIETGTEFARLHSGFMNSHTMQRGRFVIVVCVKIPEVTDPEMVDKVNELARLFQ